MSSVICRRTLHCVICDHQVQEYAKFQYRTGIHWQNCSSEYNHQHVHIGNYQHFTLLLFNKSCEMGSHLWHPRYVFLQTEPLRSNATSFNVDKQKLPQNWNIFKGFSEFWNWLNFLLFFSLTVWCHVQITHMKLVHGFPFRFWPIAFQHSSLRSPVSTKWPFGLWENTETTKMNSKTIQNHERPSFHSFYRSIH